MAVQARPYTDKRRKATQRLACIILWVAVSETNIMGSMIDFDKLVHIEASEPLTTSLHIAEWTGVKHKNVLELARKYTSQLSVFGRVAFETRPFETAGGTQERDIVLLNEGQATLLITFMRNTEKVIDFKVALVKAFLAAKDLMFNEYRGLAKQHANLCLELKDEKQIASLSGRNLSLWRKKHKVLAKAIADVEQKMQPSLNFDD